MPTSKHRSDCRISYVLDILGDRWSLLILRDLMFRGKSTYGEFKGSEEKIATNILADRLRALEESGIISKSRDPDKKTSYRYRLTRKGLDLLPSLVELLAWGAKYAPKTGGDGNSRMRDLTIRAFRDKAALIREVTADVENNQLALTTEPSAR